MANAQPRGSTTAQRPYRTISSHETEFFRLKLIHEPQYLNLNLLRVFSGIGSLWGRNANQFFQDIHADPLWAQHPPTVATFIRNGWFGGVHYHGYQADGTGPYAQTSGNFGRFWTHQIVYDNVRELRITFDVDTSPGKSHNSRTIQPDPRVKPTTDAAGKRYLDSRLLEFIRQFRKLAKLTLDVCLLEEKRDSVASNPAFLGTYDLPDLSVIIPQCLEAACGRTSDGRPPA